MPDAAVLLAAYDAQLRGPAEVVGASRRASIGPLTVAVFPAGYGFVTYRDLGGADEAGVRDLVSSALEVIEADPDVAEAEWKTRAHDRAPGLHAALVDAGFTPAESESVMIGAADRMAVDVPLPDGVALRRVEAPDDVRAASAMAEEVFGDEVSEARVQDLLGRIARGAELWVAELDGVVVSTGRLEPVPGTEFAGLWGGATRPEHRGRGIYRALTAERARSAVRLGVRWITSDSTGFSRPILERSGFVKVTETTPYEWRRP